MSNHSDGRDGLTETIETADSAINLSDGLSDGLANRDDRDDRDDLAETNRDDMVTHSDGSILSRHRGTALQSDDRAHLSKSFPYVRVIRLYAQEYSSNVYEKLSRHAVTSSLEFCHE